MLDLAAGEQKPSILLQETLPRLGVATLTQKLPANCLRVCMDSKNDE
jgi:hypothetical protein